MLKTQTIKGKFEDMFGVKIPMDQKIRFKVLLFTRRGLLVE